MGPEGFRKLALALPEAIEKEHMQHPDFRVGGKIFATLGYPDEHFAMVKLSSEQQKEFVSEYPESFRPVPGGWGLKGCTHVILRKATKPQVQAALAAAWNHNAPAEKDEKLRGTRGRGSKLK